MKLTVLGSTGSMSGPSAPASGYLIQAEGVDPSTGEDRTWSIVLDLGPGSFGQLWSHVDPREVDALFISHGHADHLADIISYYVFVKWHPDGHQEPVPTFGPAEVLERIHQIDGYASEEDICACFDFTALTAASELSVGPMHISTFPGEHPIESYGFRVEGPTESNRERTVTIAYTGDTDACVGMEEMASDADLLLSECGFTEDILVRGVHLTGVRAGSLAAQANVRRLVLTHIQPWTDPEIVVDEARREFSGPIDVAISGQTWSV